MDHELKQRLIGAVVVTALCAIFIPMLFDDPIDDSGQLVSELSIPEPVNSGEDMASKLPASTDEVLTQSDSESLPPETDGDILESTGAEEEDEQPIDESSDIGVVEEVSPPVKTTKPEKVQPKSTTPKPLSAQKLVDADVVEEVEKPVKATKPEMVQPKSMPPKPVSAPKPVDAYVAEEVKKPVKAPKPQNIQPKVVSAQKPLDAVVEEGKKPVSVPKVEPSKATPELVRWYIQVGSFSQKENALSLWDKLRQQGFPVSLDTIPSEQGATIYRLRIGPELDGKRAAAMKSKLDKQNIKAILLSE